MEYDEFLKADILCMLHDHSEMTVTEINSILGTDIAEVKSVLAELVEEEKVVKVGSNRYRVIDEISVKRLKKTLPGIF